MAASTGLVVVEGELEAGDDEHPVRSPGARGLALDLGEVERERHLVDRAEAEPFLHAPGIVRAHDVVGDAEDVEAGSSVEIDELGDGELAVAPARVGVELAEQWSEASSHCPHRDPGHPRRGEKSG